MNETEQAAKRGATTQEVAAALEREHTADGEPPRLQPPPSQKSGKLPRAVVWFVVGCFVLNLLMMATVVTLYAVRRGQRPAESSTVSENEHEGEIYIEDSDLGGMWLPEHKNLQKNTLLPSDITQNGVFKACNANGVRARLGVDVSEFQTVTDWDKVKAAGVEFVMVRVGWRGYEQGALHEDEKFREHIEGAQKAGLAVGVYFFSQAVTPGEARLEADFLLERIADYRLTYPVAFDWESVDSQDARTYGLSNDQLTAVARAFCDAVKDKGYTPMVYFYKHLGYLQYDLSALSECDFWLSEPGDAPTFHYRFTMWQYAVDGKVDGIDGAVDLDLCFSPYDAPAATKANE